MKALVWKELRELAWPVGVAIGGSVALVTVYAGAQWRDPDTPLAWLIWFLATPVLAVLAGCYAIARERARRTVEWGSCFPVSRAQVWVAKFTVSLLALALVYLVTACLAAWADTAMFVEEMAPSTDANVTYISLHMAAVLLLFSLAFVLSGVRRDPLDALLVTVLAALVICIGWLFATADILPHFFGPQLGMLWATFPPSTGLVLGLLLAVVFLAASAYGIIATPPLSFGRRVRRTVALGSVLVVLLLPSFLIGVRYFGEPSVENIPGFQYGEVSDDGRWIAFLDNRTVNCAPANRLWVVRPDGTGLRCLARGPVGNFRWMPDNESLFVRWGSKAADVHFLPRPSECLYWPWIVHVSGQKRRLPIPPGVEDWSLAISPKGTYWNYGAGFMRLKPTVELVPASALADFRGWAEDESAFYSSVSIGGQSTLWKSELPSGKLLGPVAENPPGADLLMLSPRAEWIAWEHREEVREQGHLLQKTVKTTLERLDGSARLQFDGGPFWMGWSWSPDLRHFWLRRDDRVLVADLVEGRIVRELADDAWTGENVRYRLWWSPDASRVAFHTAWPSWEPPTAHTWVAKADGTDLRQVASADRETLNFGGGWTVDNRLVLQPDSKRLILLDPDTGEQTEILTIPNARSEMYP